MSNAVALQKDVTFEPARVKRKAVRNVRVIDDLEGIAALGDDWNRLLPTTAAPFQTHAWNLAWYRNFPDEYDEILVFIVSFGGEVVAIIPAYRDGGAIRLAGDGICDYQDVITSERDEAVAGFHVMTDWCRRLRPGCRLAFEKLSTRGWLFWVLRNLDDRALGFLRFSRRVGPCPWIELPDSLQDYLASLPKKLRGDLRRALNRLDRELPEAEIVCLREEELDAARVEAAAAYHVRHFRKGGASPLEDERLVAMLAEAAQAPEVGLRLSKLKAGGATLAVDFGFARAGTYYGYLTGFDAAFEKLSPGKCLLLLRIERWRHHDGIQIVDCLCGGEPYKVGLAQGQQYEIRSITLLPATLLGAIRLGAMFAGWLTRGICNRVLKKLGRDPLPH